MKRIIFQIESVRYRGKEKDKGLLLRSFMFRRELTQNKTWFYSQNHRYFITELSHKRNGIQYVPQAELEVKGLYFMYVYDTLYKLLCIEKEYGYIVFDIEVSNKQEFKKLRY